VILRKKHRYSQSSLAKAIGVSTQSIKLWEAGSGFPSQLNKLELAKVLGREVLDQFYKEECELLSSYLSA